MLYLYQENQTDVVKAIISASQYLDYLINIDNDYFDHW